MNLADELEALASNILNANLGHMAGKMREAAEALRVTEPAQVVTLRKQLELDAREASASVSWIADRYLRILNGGKHG